LAAAHGAVSGLLGTAFAGKFSLGMSPASRQELTMKKSALLVALSAASLVGSVAFAQAQPQSKPYSDTKPEATKPMDTGASSGPTLAELDKNKDGVIDKQEAMASPSLSASFDKADINKDGKLDAAEFSAAPMSKTR
jgi:hypothetical protein